MIGVYRSVRPRPLRRKRSCGGAGDRCRTRWRGRGARRLGRRTPVPCFTFHTVIGASNPFLARPSRAAIRSNISRPDGCCSASRRFAPHLLVRLAPEGVQIRLGLGSGWRPRSGHIHPQCDTWGYQDLLIDARMRRSHWVRRNGNGIQRQLESRESPCDEVVESRSRLRVPGTPLPLLPLVGPTWSVGAARWSVNLTHLAETPSALVGNRLAGVL